MLYGPRYSYVMQYPKGSCPNLFKATDSEASCLRSGAPAQHTHSVMNGNGLNGSTARPELAQALMHNLPLLRTAARRSSNSRRRRAARYAYSEGGCPNLFKATDSEASCFRSGAPAQHTLSVMNGHELNGSTARPELAQALMHNLPLLRTAARRSSNSRRRRAAR
jgi:hypothetical protein